MKSIIILSSWLSFVVAQSNFVCYFPNWSTYRPGNGKYTVANIDPSKCTHLIYAFAVLDPTTYIMKVYDSWADIDLGGYANAVALKQKNPKLKVMIAIGGWNDSSDSNGAKYSFMVSSAAGISNFVTNAVIFLQKYGFDGLDLDWEYPSSPADKAGFAALTKALKSAFQPYGFLLTAAVGASVSTADKAYDLPQLALYVDYLNVMTYDMHGSWDLASGTDHHAPLYKRSFDAVATNNIDSMINYFIQKGFPASKINMGIPLYGRGWTLSGTTTSLQAPVNNPIPAGPLTNAPGSLAYYEICTNVKNGWTKVSDPARLNGPYAYSLSARSWIGYDDVDMAAYKVSYIRSKGLAGAMVWDVSLDDFMNTCGGGVNPLISAIYSALNSGTIVTTTIAPATTTKGTATTTKATASTTKATATTTKATATTTTKTPGVFVCPGDGLYPDPTTCTKFYSCANTMKYSMACPSGLYFNPTVKVCDWPANVPACKF